MVYMRVHDRRARARETALELLESGVSVTALTLRMIAEHQGTPLPTLTYAYRSITELLDDLLLTMERPLFESAGDRGLAVELHHFLEVSDVAAAADPALDELRVHALRRTGELEGKGLAADRVAGTIAMITAIRERSNERYRLSDEIIGRQFRLTVEAAHLHWIDAGGLRPAGARRHLSQRRSWVRQGIDVIVLAADPMPRGLDS